MANKEKYIASRVRGGERESETETATERVREQEGKRHSREMFFVCIVPLGHYSVILLVMFPLARRKGNTTTMPD